MLAAAFEEIVGSFLRREIDALTAGTRVCEVVAQRGSNVSCALLADESMGEKVFAGHVTNDDAQLLERAVTHAGPRRGLLAREQAPDVFADNDADFVAVEPLRTRSGIHLGAVAAAGPASGREAVLGSLPAAGRVCSDIALEPLLGLLLGRKLHAFNNVLSVVTANLDYVTTTIAVTNGVFAGEDREQVVIAAAHAARGAKQLIQAAADLHEALPKGEHPRARR